jgi:hypothetical protein
MNDRVDAADNFALLRFFEDSCVRAHVDACVWCACACMCVRAWWESMRRGGGTWVRV